MLIALKRTYTGKVVEIMNNILYGFFSRGFDVMNKETYIDFFNCFNLQIYIDEILKKD